jgi:hypothetical protein
MFAVRIALAILLLLLRTPGQRGTSFVEATPSGPATDTQGLLRFLEGLRNAVEQPQNKELDEDMESHVLFREAGFLAGSVSYGHLLFTLDLAEVKQLMGLLQV